MSGEAAQRRQSAKQFLLFNLVGLMNTAVEFIVFSLLVWLGAHYMAAQIASYASGMANSYMMNSWFTFKKQPVLVSSAGSVKKFDKGRALRFVVLNLAVLGLSLPLLYLLKEQWGMNALLAKLLVTGATMVVNFIGSKRWVFRVKG